MPAPAGTVISGPIFDGFSRSKVRAPGMVREHGMVRAPGLGRGAGHPGCGKAPGKGFRLGAVPDGRGQEGADQECIGNPSIRVFRVPLHPETKVRGGVLTNFNSAIRCPPGHR